MARRQPLANLRIVHHGFGRLTDGDVPLVALAQQIGHEEYNRLESSGRERLEAETQHVDVTIIEREHYVPATNRASARLE